MGINVYMIKVMSAMFVLHTSMVISNWVPKVHSANNYAFPMCINSFITHFYRISGKIKKGMKPIRLLASAYVSVWIVIHALYTQKL